MSDVSARLGNLSREERAALVKLLKKKKEGSAPSPPPREERRELPLSFAQQRLWFLDRLVPGNPVYNVAGFLRLLGELDVAVLAASVSEIVRRHEALRTRFEIRGDGPVQIIEPAAPVPLPVIDLSALAAPLRAGEEQRIARERESAPFDLGRPPLLHTCLVRNGIDEHLFVFVFHHIASDGWSQDVAIREVAALYPAFLEGRPSPLPELPIQYADFAWQQIQTLRGDALAREVGFWRRLLAGAAPLELPTDRPRPAVPSFRGNKYEMQLPAALETGLRQLAREQRATAFMALLAPLSTLFSRLANTDDVVVGTVVAGRDRRDVAELIGFFVNTLVLRLDLSGDPDGLALLAQTRQVALEAFDHQALPFEKLVDELGLPRDPYRPPLLRALFQLLTRGQGAAELPGLRLEHYELPAETAKFDLVVNAGDMLDELWLEWRYDADLFDASTIARWAGLFEVLVAGWLEDPARRVSELPLLTEPERLQLLTGWSPEPVTADRGRRAVAELFEAQVDRTPDAPAVSAADGEDVSLTYRELDKRANQLARWLVKAGVVPGDRVALCLDRSPDLVVSLLGVLKTGAAYVPLDPSSPRERLAFALEDSRPRVVLTTELLAPDLPEGIARTVFLDREAEAIAALRGERLGLPLDPELPAYVIYTSGSTGRPKGVIVPHGSVSRLFSATARWFGFSSDDVWTLFHSYAFDFSVWEIWGALLYGGRLVVVPWQVSREPAAFAELLQRERVTVLNQTPSAFRQLMWAEPHPPTPSPIAPPPAGRGGATTQSFPPLPVEGWAMGEGGQGGEVGRGEALRYVIFGGEALDPTALEPWFTRHGDERPRLVNMYGITETTVHVTYRPLAREDAARPASLIGQPIPDLTLHALDRHLQLQPVGVPGEICVGGEGLAQGYLGRPDLTAARFVPDPFADRPGARLYRSGDLARRRPDGELEYLGRIDHQVKIRGFRIELGEIEAAIAAHPAVREAVVLARQDSAAERRLVAYVTAEPEKAPSFVELREFLAGRLPDYMLPAALVILDQLPLTGNGKVDRRALPSPEAAPAAASGREHVPPRDTVESGLAGLFRRVLNVPAEREVGVLDNFFELGGSSISGAVLVNLLQEILGEIVHVVVIFDHPTVEALAAYVREQHAGAAARVWDVAAQAQTVEEPPPGPAEVAEMLRLVVEGRPETDVQESEEPVNPPAVFILSPPRSGSTLLRVMLSAHPRLFAPPELELLSFQTMAGRHAAFSGRDSFWLEGVTRAVMEARSCDAAEAERLVEAGVREGWTTRRFYRELQGWIDGRLLVDKTPSYALDPEVLRRGERWFAGARYLHLVRHPQATNRSFEEARLDQIFFRRPHRFSRRRLAELIWTVSHRHILDFLAELPAERKHTVRFEDLVRDPEPVLAEICGFLGLELDPRMIDPYRGGARMTDGVHAVSRMLGDVKLSTYGKVDASVADRWKQAGEAPLGGPARAVAAELGYGVGSHGAWEQGGTAPASFAQERLWLLEQITPGTPAYNIPAAIRLLGRLNVPALAQVVNEIVRRHAALRTVFGAEGGQPVQKVQPVGPPRPLPVIDVSALTEGTRAAEIDRLAAWEATRPFDLERGPLCRPILVHAGPREHVVLYTMHHIVSDGWSMGVFSREVGALYAAFATGRPSPLPELRLQYPDYAIRQRAQIGEAGLARHLAWWKERLAGIEPLDVPTDRPRPAVRSGRGADETLILRPGLAGDLNALGRGERATIYMVLLATFQAFLQRFTRQDDVAVGSPVAHRSTRDVEELIGFFVNTLVMRTDLSGDPTFREALVRVRRTALDSMLHQDAPFERVVEAVQPERQLARSPLFQVLFSLQNAGGDAAELPGLTLELVKAPTATAKFDLTLLFAEWPGGIGATLEYDLDLFEPATASRLLRHMETLLEGAVAAPDARLSDLPLLAPAERETLLAAWNRTQVPFPREVPIHRLVAEQAERTPEAVALVSAAGETTYAALVAAARRLARRLRRLGAGPEVPVIVLGERSPALVTALLAVLESGGFFVPLDPSHPRERLAALAAAVGARLAITEERFLDLLPEGMETVRLDGLERDGGADPLRIDSGVTAENLAYVMFTSGSTGEPKGVAVTHRNVARLVRNQEYADLRPGETFLLFAPVSFDASTLEIWGPLANGARLAVFPPEQPTLDELAAFLKRHGVTQLWLTAGLFHQMVEERPDGFAPLRRLLAGGDVLSPSHVRRALAAHPDLLLVNGYGPTEGTTFTTCHVLTAAEPFGDRDSVPIGRPIANTQVHVLEPGLHPAPVGVWGELYAGGAGVARGYFGRPELTAERFVPDPFAGFHEPLGGRLYRTGDLARRRPDGILEFLGRGDRQVKIRGFRIEPAEIEAALAEHPDIREAAVLVRGEGGEKRLVAYVVMGQRASDRSDGSDRSDRSGEGEDLRHWLAGRLPEPMIPSAFVALPRLPLTPNGKVDRRRLSQITAKIAPERSEDNYVAPRTPVEEVLAGLFAEVLGTERTGGRIGIHDHFFELGGHSLAATRLVSRLRAALGVELPLRALFEAPTVAGLAARCGAPSANPTAQDALATAPRDPAGDPLSFSQERLWFLERLTPGTSTYNLPSRMRLRGPLDIARLERSFAEVCRRHEVLRTRFDLRGDTPVQIVEPPAPLVLPLVDLTSLPEEARHGEAARLVAEEADLPFDLGRAPLMRAILVRLGAEEHATLLNLHHIITDGWSMGILYGEIGALYRAFTEGRPSPLPELPVQYADVARWQRDALHGPALEAQLGYWRESLGGAPPSLDLPLDRVRPAVQTFHGASVFSHFPPELADRLRTLANREGGSLFMILLAGFSLLLARLSGQEDLVVGSPVAGRSRPEMESLIGFFLNTLALRVEVSGGLTGRNLTGRELIDRAKEAALGAYAHQDVPFEKLLEELQPERDLSRTPLFQVFLNMLNYPAGGSRMPDGLVMEPLGGSGVDSKFDLTLYAAEGEDGISLNAVYNADLFDRVRIEEMSRQLQRVLEQIAAPPDAPVDAVSLLTPEAVALLPDPLERLSDAWTGAVHELFAEQVRLHPERRAVSDADGEQTYGELADAVARLAGHLRAGGLQPQEPVGIWAHRGTPAVQAVFGTLWAGGAFVLLDPAYPPARLAETVELASPRYWLEIAAAGAPPAEVEEVLGRLAADGTLRGRLRLPGPLSADPVEPATVGPDDLVAIAFTSGSTGAPKGILQRHGSMSHFLPFMAERFGIGPEDRFSLLSGLSHDPFQRDLFTSLCLGASLCAPTAEEIDTPGRLAEWMAREKVTVSNLTPAMAQLLTEAGGGPVPVLTDLRAAFLIGDALTRADVERLRRLAPGVLCVNLYGSTETQRALSYHVVAPEESTNPRAPQILPLGRGMRDAQLLVARGDAPRLAGIGELGEIWVRSPHLARGYLADEALTADRFWPDPFWDPTDDPTDRSNPSDRSDASSSRVYRTGDLGRYRPDGEVTFAGRADQQVKIRGFRIEPAEVEAALGRQAGVREAVVLARETGRPGDRELVAYVAGEGLDPARLREALRSRLPGYMVPSGFVLLDELPVTPNGKMDRRALARIEPERDAAGFVAPRTPTEEALSALWVDVLGARRTGGRVGVRDHFFALGGHSLLATRLMAAVRDAFGVELPLRVLFEQPTIEGLAAAVESAEKSGVAVDAPVVRIPREPGVNRFPVSFSQLREWILDRLEPGNPAYNIPNYLRIGGPLSIPVLTEALNRLVERHEVFRTAFIAGEEEPLQIVVPEVRLQVPVLDLSALPGEAREAELTRCVRHHAATGFDLATAPLLRARIVRLGADEHALLMTVHHIISDGWSMGILNQELAALYEASAAGAPSPLPPLPVQYADYAVWLRRRLDPETLERQAVYWKERLTGAPPLLELPTDRPRPPVRSSRGTKVPFFLPQPLAGQLEELALRHGATLFMVILAGYQSLLARWSGQDDVVVGTYSGNRPRRELEGLIGFFINTLVLRTDLSGDPSFAELLGRVRETTLEAYAHRDVPFEKLLETLQLPRDPSRTPLFQALLVLHNFPTAQADLSTGVRLSGLPVGAEKSDYDLSLWLGEGLEGVGGSLEYSTDLFDEATALRFTAQLRTLLEAAVAEPERNVWMLPLITEEEQERQLEAWSCGPTVPEGSPLLHRLVEEQAERTQNAVALEAGGVRLTYAELVEQARRQARLLRDQGIGEGSIVALAAERTPELIVRMLAVLQAGAAYLPIDPAYPQERREFMVADSGAVVVEGSKDLKDIKDPKDESSPEAPAYLIYTSGSTGRPKGVVVPHRAIASFVRAARATYDLAPGDRVLQFASISFDTSAEEIWPALASGATLVLRPDDMAASIPHFLRELERLGITCLDLPTAFWHEMVAGMEAEDLALPHGLRLVILGGEEALADRFALWHRRVGPAVRLVNTYGPTETTIVATRRELSGLAPGAAVPIGRPIPGARAYVLDRFLEPVPPGVRGELWIGGSGMAHGYLGRPDLTAERFRPDPFVDATDHPTDRSDRSDHLGARLYRTGDLAVLRPDGDLVFAGRADRQLKIRGYRIEPGEIEAALRLHPALHDAVVDVRGPRDGQRLIAWIVPAEGIEAPGASDLRAFLRERLPEPLLPAAFVPLPALPVTPSGKVHRRALLEPAEALPDNVAYAEPQSALERTIAEIYRELLRVSRIGLHDNFFDLGGHSLLIVRAHQKLKEALGKEIPVLDLFRFPTVAALARHLGGEETGNLQKVQGLADQQRAAQQRQKAAMERLRRPGRRG
ncbi:MAG TPA: amino acid adenylation domain-containing protein [Thermoanaerobaculia bacterium]|nr:amino acid adenylation domain-containing protein [Thermoanaerobaculia bacterium]